MKQLYYLRHAKRTKPEPHLNQEGVDMARSTAQRISKNFHHVMTSNLPRAIETAIAMGFAVDEIEEKLSTMKQVEGILPWRKGYAGIQNELNEHDRIETFCKRQGNILKRLLSHVNSGQSILVISHRGILESGVVGALPDFDFSDWDFGANYCCGAKLAAKKSRFQTAEPLRFHE